MLAHIIWPASPLLKPCQRDVLRTDQLFYTLGYHRPGDGGANFFFWDPESTETPDRATILALVGKEQKGRLKAVFLPVANVRQFGALGDGIDDTDALQAAVAYSKKHGVPLYLPVGHFVTQETLILDAEGTQLVGENRWRSILALHEQSGDTACVRIAARLADVSDVFLMAPGKVALHLVAGSMFSSKRLVTKFAAEGIRHEVNNCANINHHLAESCGVGYRLKPIASGDVNGSEIHGRAVNCDLGFDLCENEDDGIDPSYCTITYSTEANTVGFRQRGGRYNKLNIYSESNRRASKNQTQKSKRNWDVDLSPANRWQIDDPDGDFPEPSYTSRSNLSLGRGLELKTFSGTNVSMLRTQDFRASGSIAGAGVSVFRVSNSSNRQRTLTLSQFKSAPIGHIAEIIKTDKTPGFTLAAPTGMTLIDCGGAFGAYPKSFALAKCRKLSESEILVERSEG